MKAGNLQKRFFGNVFIFISLLGIFYIYFPLLFLYFFPAKEPMLKNDSFFIEIPKIKVKSIIIPNVDPFNQKEYREALEKGIAHAKKTSLPGDNGTSFLFGHSSDEPWRITRYNTVFLKLGELNNGDLIIINRNGKKYTYKVSDKKTVWPNEVKYLSPNSENKIILQTCTPIGTALMRLLIFAKPIN